ncbi:MAG TPA: site-2 protease family protein [Gemmataceae bacterium]|nr:site-2 protease family protein [Gemmataceae bacterium]
MGWSFKIGRLAGIDIFVHFTFLLLLGWIGFAGFTSTGDVGAALASVALVCAVFVIIVLHELGHAMAARYYGIPTRDITLLPIGGVARLERMPEKPAQELVVALAGPAVNVVLAGIFFVIAMIQDLSPPESVLTFGDGLVLQLLLVNVGLVLFNMLPAFPMDGGRVLRALLAMRLGPTRATEIAATVGRGMAIVLGSVGLLLPLFGGPMQPMLVLVAIFVWIGAGEERAAVQARHGLAGVPVHALMVRRFVAVAPDDTLGTVAYYLRRGYQQDFPVVVDGRMVGLLTGNDLMYAMSEYGSDTRVFQVMQRDFPSIGPEDPVEHGLALLSTGHPFVPVIHARRLFGLLTAENVTRYLWVRRAGRREPPSLNDSDYPAGSRA